MGVFIPEYAKNRNATETYHPETGKWTKSTDALSGEAFSEKVNNEIKKTIGNTSNLTSKTGNSKSSLGSVSKKYNTIELKTLEGQLQYIVTKDTIKLQAGDTVKIKGVGKYLSGDYYVKEVNRSLSSSGYTNTAVVIKTNFGDTLKTETKVTKKTSKGAKNPNTSKDTVVNKDDKKENLVLTDDLRKHVASAIWNGNYGWEPNRDKKLREIFGANNGILAVYNKGVKYVAGVSPAGYSYSDMKKKYGK